MKNKKKTKIKIIKTKKESIKKTAEKKTKNHIPQKNLNSFRLPVLVGNWKLNPTSFEEAKRIFTGVVSGAGEVGKGTMLVAPPIIYTKDLLSWVYRSKKGEKIHFATQDLFYENSGAYTGSIGALMVRDANISASILGHSEVRKNGDTDEIVNAKILSALKAGLSVIVCFGEPERNDDGRHLEFIRNQLVRTLRGVTQEYMHKVCIAYEPIWAIGSGNPIMPNDLHEMILYMRKLLVNENSIRHLANVPILYGGSVTKENAEQFISLGMADGLLVGKQSLDPESFVAIYNSLLKGFKERSSGSK